MQAVSERLLELGIAPRKVHTRDLTVQPEYVREQPVMRNAISYIARTPLSYV
jgi:uncharacterized protein YggE